MPLPTDGPRAAERAASSPPRLELAALEALLATSSDAHSLHDEHGRFHWASATMCERLGYAPPELLARRVSDIDPEFPVERFAALFAEARRARIPPFETLHQRRDGSTFPVEVSVSVVALTEGERLFATVRDLSARKSAEAAREAVLAAERTARAQLHGVLARISDAFFALDREWRFTYVNEQAARMLGRPRAALLGRPLLDAFPEAAGSPFEQEYARAFETGTPAAFEAFYPPLDRWFAVRAYPGPEGLSVYFQDANERRRSEAALRASEARFRGLVEGAVVGLVIGDDAGGMSFVNDALLAMLGYTRADVDPAQGGTPLRWDVLTPPEFRERDAAALTDLARHGRAAPYEKVYLAKDGRAVPILIGPTLLGRRADGTLEIGAFVVDLTARVEAARTLAARSAERERLLEAERTALARTERLHALSARLAAASTPAEVAAATLEAGVLATGAPRGTVARLTADGDALELLAQAGYSDEAIARWRHFPNIPEYPLGQVVQRRRPLVVSRQAEFVVRFPALADWARSSGYCGSAMYPLLAGGEPGRVLGTLTFDFDHDREYTADELRFLEAITGLCAQALARAEAYEAQQAARAEAEAERQRLALILDQLPVGVVVVDATGAIVHHNALLARVLGHAPHAAGAVDDYAAYGALHADGRPFAAEDYPIARALLHGEVVEQELMRYRCGDGTTTRLAVSAAPIRDADGTTRFAVAALQDVSERERTAAALQRSEERYALAARATSNAIWDWNLLDDTVTWNVGIHHVFGHPEGGVAGTSDWWAGVIHPDDRARVVAGIHAVIDGANGGHEWRDGYRFRRGDGSYAEVVDRGYLSRDAAGRAVRMIGAMEDVTAQRELEERLRQAQKMEAVGQLAGGIAHDFNNLLTVITGNLEFAQEEVPEDSPVRGDLAEIADAAERARGLVRQLLTFSRKQPVQRRLVRLGDVVRGAERLLRRVIGEEIVLTVDEGDDPAVHADPGQLEQVLLNLAVNARDAMLTPLHGHAGRGGTLAIRVATVALGVDEAARWDGVTPGRWARLEVRDTGHGIDADAQRHLFEPFFTTKALGSGTGLGLATVFGIVRQAGGAIRVESAPGAGTTVTVLLPLADAAAPDRGAAAPSDARGASSGTVLLVEDEPGVRATARRILERGGYTVLEAAHGADALRRWERERAAIDAVVTDVRMPELGGRELVAQLRAEWPELPVVLMSGYSEPAAERPPGASETFVEKPFTAASLLGALAAALASGPR